MSLVTSLRLSDFSAAKTPDMMCPPSHYVCGKHTVIHHVMHNQLLHSLRLYSTHVLQVASQLQKARAEVSNAEAKISGHASALSDKEKQKKWMKF